MSYQGGYGGGYPGQQPQYGGQSQPMGYGGQPPAGGYPGAQPGAYGGQQAPGGYNGQQGPGGFPPPQQYPGVSPQVQQWFNAVDRDRSGKINAKELQSALINGKGQNFTDSACQLMIGMFDTDRSGCIDIQEFEKLYTYINQWLAVFKTYDRDNSGHIEESELSQALQQMGFRFSPEFIKFLVSKSDLQNHKEVSVDQFIVMCVQIQRFTEAFRQRDTQQSGTITIGFEEFLGVALSCSVTEQQDRAAGDSNKQPSASAP